MIKRVGRKTERESGESEREKKWTGEQEGWQRETKWEANERRERGTRERKWG